MDLYGLKTCDTCRKALKEFHNAGKDVRFVDVRQDGLPQGQLERFHAAFGDALVNRRSTTWRNLDEDARAGDPVALLLAHPTLMKRPLIDDGTTLHLGWSATTKAALL